VSHRESESPLLYRYKRIAVRFPKPTEAAGGATMPYRYHVIDEAGETAPRAVFNCRIPRTIEALKLMNNRFHVEGEPRAKKEDEVVTTMDCPPGYICLPGITNSGWFFSGYYSPTYGGGSWGDQGGWGSSYYETEPSGPWSDPGSPEQIVPCDPAIDEKCHQFLTDADRLTIPNALNAWVRPVTEIQDPTARVRCAELVEKFGQLYEAGKVFRGRTTTMLGDPGADPHWGAYDPGTGWIHFDPKWLDAAAAGDESAAQHLANTALHEAAHALGYEHSDPVNTPWGPAYTEEPYTHLVPGANSCVKFN
jgi:hypothetical protein